MRRVRDQAGDAQPAIVPAGGVRVDGADQVANALGLRDGPSSAPMVVRPARSGTTRLQHRLDEDLIGVGNDHNIGATLAGEA